MADRSEGGHQLKIHQYHSGTHPRDAITHSMLILADKFQQLGIRGDITAEHVHSELVDRVRRFDSSKIASDDILLVHHSFYNGLIDEIALTPCRKVLIYHNITKPEFFAATDPMRSAAVSGYQQLWALREIVEATISDSLFNARGLFERGFKNVKVICLLKEFSELPSLPSAGYPYHYPEDIFHILFVGRICANKGQHHLIRAVPHLERRLGKRVRLTFCGHADHGTDYLKILDFEINRLGVADRVEFLGSVPDDVLFGFYRAADAYVSYSQHEGFGVPLIEAMAFGTPVFAYRNTAIAETLGDAGWLLDSLHPEELVDAILKVFHTRFSRRAFIRKQRLRAKELSLSETFPYFIRYIQETFHLSLSSTHFAREAGQKAERQVIFEGPLDGIYSLSQVNRCLSASLSAVDQINLSAVPREGTDDYRFDQSECQRSTFLKDILYRSVDITIPSVGIRNMYPTRPRGQLADIRLQFLFWEESRLPSVLVQQINAQLDGIVTATNYCAKVFRDSGVTVPVRVVGHGPVNPSPLSRVPRQQGDPFIFLHVSSGLPRKGVEELFQAFFLAFTKFDRVQLIIKTYENQSNIIPSLVQKYSDLGFDMSQLLVNTDIMTSEELTKLYSLADALVLPTRGEGFNLPAAEAIQANIPLIVTGTGAHLDFCDKDNAIFLKWKFEYSLSHLAEQGSYWARVDSIDLAGKMRSLVTDPTSFKSMTTRPLGGWSMVADNILSFASELNEELPVKEVIKLASISTYNTRCGIATYVATLMNEFSSHLYQIEHWATKETPISNLHETDSVVRLWSCLDGSFSELCQRAIDRNFDAVLIQFNFGFFDLEDFFNGIALLNEHGIGSHVVFHKTADGLIGDRPVSLSGFSNQLKLIDSIYVHDVDDVNFLSSLDVHGNVILVPLFINDFPLISKKVARSILDLPLNNPIFATNGFLLPNKGVLDLIKAFALLRNRYPKSLLLIVCSLFEAPESRDLLAACNEIIQLLGLQNNIHMINDFLHLEQIHMLLSAADLIVYPYGYSRESASASIRQGIAAGRPILGTKSPIFSNVQAAITALDKPTPETLCEAMLSVVTNDAVLKTMTRQAVDFRNGQTPKDIARIVSANIQLQIVNQQGVEFPLFTKNSPELPPSALKNSTALLSQRSFDTIHRNLLGRDPSETERMAFHNDITKPGGSLVSAVKQVLGSEEFFLSVSLDPERISSLKFPALLLDRLFLTSVSQFAMDCYRLILGRPGSTLEIEGLIERLTPDSIEERNRIVEGMLSSEEYKRFVFPRSIHTVVGEQS